MKNKYMEIASQKFERIPIKTDILKSGDDIIEVIKKFTKDKIQLGDIITVSESPLAITQGRAIPVNEIKIGFVANILWRFVSKVPYGIGLRAPTSMQCAVEEVGALRIIFAAFIGGITRFFGRRGDFYRIAGMQAALIDAATTSPVPPYSETVIKGPKNPEKVAQMIKDKLGHEAAIMDINDIGGSWAIGVSDGLDKKFIEAVMKDNPQGQGDELTPICLVRKINK